MTSFLPASPRRKWHPSQWNIVRVGSAIGTALVLGGCNDDTVGATDQAEQSDTLDTGDATEWDEYSTDYSDWSEQDGYTDYTEYTDYTDYADWSEQDGYNDSYWYPECYIDDDCGPGWECIYNYCEPVPYAECRTSSDCDVDEFCDAEGSCHEVQLPSECLAPALQQIPLPAEAGGVIVALKFVDVDVGAEQELVLLRDDAIVVVDGDQVTTVPHGAYALDGIAATDVDADQAMDLIATSSTKLNSRVFQNDGLGGFIDTGTGPAMMLDHPHGIDWPTGGPGELLARSAADEAVILSSLVQQMPEIELPQLLNLDVVDGLAVGYFNPDTDLDALALHNCNPQVADPDGGGYGRGGFGPVGSCSVSVGDLDGDPLTDFVLVRADASFSLVSVHAPPDDLGYVSVGLPGAYQVAQPVNFDGASLTLIVQSGPNLELLYGDQFGSWCRGALDGLPPILRFAVGDFDGDGDHELATVDTDGAVALWSDD